MKSTFFSVFLLAATMLGADAESKIWIIKADGLGEAVTIQAGIDTATPGDTLLVSQGTYTGTGNRGISTAGKPLLIIAEWRYNPLITAPSTIDLQGEYLGFIINSSEDSTTILDGLSITWAYREGINCSNASPRIRYCAITSCNPCIRLSHANSIIEHSLLSSTPSIVGVAINCEYSSPNIQFNEIHGNGEENATAIACTYCTSMNIIGNTITAPGGETGVGIYLELTGRHS